MPTPGEVRALLQQYARLGEKFPHYNVREYLKRRAAEALAALDSTSGTSGSTTSSAPPSSLLAGVGAETPEAADKAFSRAAEELRSFERQAVVYELYARKDLKNVLEVDADAAAAAAAAKGK